MKGQKFDHNVNNHFQYKSHHQECHHRLINVLYVEYVWIKFLMILTIY